MESVRVGGWLFGAAMALGCGPTVTIIQDTEAGTGVGSASGEETQGPDGTDADSLDDTGAPTMNTNKVDILFVIDNSGSMGDEQRILAADFAGFADVLEVIGADYRIGVTTTDNGNPWCTGTTPEGGQLRLSSCRSRASEFVFMGAVTLDEYDETCGSVCIWDTLTVAATSTVNDANMAPRPWLQVSDGTSNVVSGTCAPGADCGSAPTIAEAFQCFSPQGINGCGFEQQLESMYKALARFDSDTESGYDFMRSDAMLAVVIVTDEADCSHNNDQDTIFLPDGNRTFWSLPEEGAPTSAVCWNAGVECSGEDCASKNVDANNAPTNEDAAVMRPVSRYTTRLQEIEDARRQAGFDTEVLVALVAGVGAGGDVTYSNSLDQGFQDDFGIGPGCTSDAGQAVPPVRLRELAEAFVVDGAQNMFSVCDSSYGAALNTIVEAVAEQMGA